MQNTHHFIHRKAKDTFLDIISFNTPKARLINFSSILTILAVVPTEKLTYSPVKCVFKHFILPWAYGGVCPDDGLFAGCNCPACGMTRGMSRLLHGDPAGAWAFNKLVFLVLALIIVLVIFDLRKLIKGRKKGHGKGKAI